ncbi:MAG: hypothetical protein ACFB50_06230 [Rubrobacteraceae bacterium]
MTGIENPQTSRFGEYLAPIASGISPALISAPALSHIESVARWIPEPLATNTFGFECRLGEDLPHADFLVVATAARGRSSLAGLDPSSPLPDRLKTHPVWQRVEDFAARWADPSSPLHNAVDNVWLEFDVDGPPPEVPLPGVFFGILPDYAPEEVVPPVLRVLSGDGISPRVLDNVVECLQALPPHGNVFQVGLMLSRGPVEAVRLCIWTHSKQGLLEYLGNIGPGLAGAGLRRVLDSLDRMVDHIALDMDVGDRVHDKLGFECYFSQNRQPSREPRWAAFLDSLVQDGLCTAGKRDALLAYTGYTEEKGATGIWPEALRRASGLLGQRFTSTFVRSLHHVKIVYEPGKPLEAKAYLAGNHLWRGPRS